MYFIILYTLYIVHFTFYILHFTVYSLRFPVEDLGGWRDLFIFYVWREKVERRKEEGDGKRRKKKAKV